jgi:arylsulfatase A-like enzyme
MGFTQPARVRTVVTKDWQFSVYKDQSWGELYDLRNDPPQTRNLWTDPEHQQIKASLFETLAKHLIEQMDESPRSSRMA